MTRIAEIIDAAHTQALVSGLDFRIVTRIAGQQQQVVAGHVGPGTAGPGESGQGELVIHREVLQAQVRALLDPPRREDGRLPDPRRVVQRRGQEILALQRVALRGVDEGGVIEDVLSHLGPDEGADIELPPAHLAVHAEREVRVGVADHGVILGSRGQRLSVHAPRARGAAEQLLARCVPPHEDGPVERPERMPRENALRHLSGLPLAAHAAAGEEGVGTEIDDSVPLRREDEPCPPAETGAIHHHGVERPLQPAIANLAHVLEPGGGGRRRRHGHRENQVFRVLDVILDGPREPVVHEAVIQREVVLRRLLPLEVRVGIARRDDAGDGRFAEDVARAARGRQQNLGRVRGDGRVALQAVTDPQPQVRQRQRGVRHEVLPAQVPRRRQGREQRPLVIDAELGRPVIAQHPGHIVLVPEAVVGPREEGDEHPIVAVGVRREEHRGRTEVVEAEVVGDVAVPLGAELLRRVLAVLVPAHDVQGVGAELPPQRQQGLERHRGVVAVHLARQPVPLGSDRTERGEVDLRQTVGPIDADIHLARHPRHQIHLGRHVPEGAGRVPELLDLIRHRHRIAHRLRTGADLVIVHPGGIGVRDRARGVVHRHVLEHPAFEAAGHFIGEIVVVDLGGRHVEPEAQAIIERVVGRVEAPLNALEAAGEGHALLVHVVERRAIARVLTPTRERHVVIVRDGGAGHRALPIRIRRAQGGQIRRVQTLDLERVRVVDLHLLLNELPVLRPVQHVQIARRGGHRHVAIVLHARPGHARPMLLRLDEDDTVGRAAAVDRRRGGVLEHRDRGDVRGVEQVERAAGQRRVTADAERVRFGLRAVDRDAVDHVQRLVGRAERRPAADADLRPGPRLAVVRNHLDPGGTTLEHLVHVRRHADVRRGRVDGRDRAGDRLTALRAVAGHDDRLENRRRLMQHEPHRRRASRRHRHILFLRQIPDARRSQAMRARGDGAQDEAAVVAADRSDRRAQDGHVDAGKGLLARAVDDLPRDGARGILRAELRRPQQATDECGNDVTD